MGAFAEYRCNKEYMNNGTCNFYFDEHACPDEYTGVHDAIGSPLFIHYSNYYDSCIMTVSIGSVSHLTDDTMLQGQGCYNDEPSDRDLPVEVMIDQLTPEACIEQCSLNGNKYAATQVLQTLPPGYSSHIVLINREFAALAIKQRSV